MAWEVPAPPPEVTPTGTPRGGPYVRPWFGECQCRGAHTAETVGEVRTRRCTEAFSVLPLPVAGCPSCPSTSPTESCPRSTPVYSSHLCFRSGRLRGSLDPSLPPPARHCLPALYPDPLYLPWSSESAHSFRSVYQSNFFGRAHSLVPRRVLTPCSVRGGTLPEEAGPGKVDTTRDRSKTDLTGGPHPSGKRTQTESTEVTTEFSGPCRPPCPSG